MILDNLPMPTEQKAIAAAVKTDRLQGGSVSHVAIVARVTVREGKADEYVAAFAPLLEQAEKEPGTILYAVHRSKDDPHVFWTTEAYADDDGFAAHSASEVHAAASPVFTELIAAADIIIGERYDTKLWMRGLKEGAAYLPK
jgi:(4S)-4-hydroxy-5-phosphonooxypentane-2,3-dione isomerase